MRSRVLRISILIGIVVIMGMYQQTQSQDQYTKSEEKAINQGLNQYIDPSASEIYDKEYVTVEVGDGSKSDTEVTELVEKIKDKEPTIHLDSEIKNLSKSEQETTQAIIITEAEPVKEQIQEEIKTSLDLGDATEAITLNSEDGDAEIEQLKQDPELIVTETSNKELMDILYPPKEQIDKINEEIQAERRAIIDFEKSRKHQEWKGKSVKEKITSLVQPETKANKLSNSSDHLVIYANGNINMNIDLMGNGQYTGNQLHMWPRNNGYAQDWWFDNNTGEIRPYQGSNMCVEVAYGSYYNGTTIRLHPCNGHIAQKWETWPDRTIRAQGAKWLCMDASAGINQGSRIHGWTCHGGANQKFLVGQNDFANFNHGRYIRISSRNTPSGNLVGHSFVSIGYHHYYKGHVKPCVATNTFGYFDTLDMDADNTVGRDNNIRTYNNLWVDNISDWNAAIGSHVQQNQFRHRDMFLSKAMYDEIKYMNGYYMWYKDFWNDTVTPYTVNKNNCAQYARDMWWKYSYTHEWYNVGNNAFDIPTPGEIYTAIGDYNWDGKSVCSIHN